MDERIKAHMALVDDFATEYAMAHCERLYGGSKSYTKQCLKDADEARAAVEAALRAPQQAEPLTDAQKQDIHNATGAGHSLICLVESYVREHFATPPSAPTAVEPVVKDSLTTAAAVEPLFGEMIAQHPGLREEMLAESERAEFEAWYMQEYPTLDHAQILTRQRDWTYKFSHVQAIWEAWQARASKGTK